MIPRGREPSWFWLVPIALGWPLLQVTLFLVRFKRLPEDVIPESSTFLPIGLLSGAFLLLLLRRTGSRRRRIATIIGYLLAVPLAIMGALLGGLLFAPMIGAAVYGTLPLLIGAGVGWFIGQTWEK